MTQLSLTDLLALPAAGVVAQAFAGTVGRVERGQRDAGGGGGSC